MKHQKVNMVHVNTDTPCGDKSTNNQSNSQNIGTCETGHFQKRFNILKICFGYN